MKGPELPGNRHVDKIDIILIPFFYLVWMALTLTFLAKLILKGTPYFIGRTLFNGCIWTSISLIHISLTLLCTVHSLVQLPAKLILQNPIIRWITYWPKVYWSLFRPSSGRRSILNIICEPVLDFRPKTKNIPNQCCINQNRNLTFWHMPPPPWSKLDLIWWYGFLIIITRGLIDMCCTVFELQ